MILLAKYIRVYIRLFKISIMVFFAHRFNLAMSFIANIVWTFSQITALKFLSDRLPDLQGWNFHNLVMLLAFTQIFVYSNYIFYGANLDKVSTKILSGDFDFRLLKPIDIRFLASFEQVQVAQIISFLITVIPLFAYGIIDNPSIKLPGLPQAAVVLLLSLVIFYFLNLSITGLAFYFERIDDFRAIVITRAHDLPRTPVDLHPKVVQAFLKFVLPIAFVAYYPALLATGQTGFLPVISTELILIVIFIFLSRLVWQRGLRYYSGVA